MTSTNRSTTPMTTTTWQRHVTSQMDGTQGQTDDDNVNTSFRRDEDDLARQRTCHIVETVTTQGVVTVHMNSGKPLSLFSFIHTRTRGHVAIGDVATKWMII